MKKKICLINFKYKVDIDFEQKESLALGYLAGVLKENGYHVDIIDGQFERLDVNDIFQLLLKEKYDLIGISLYDETRKYFEEFYTLFKNSKINTFLCLGGHFPTFSAKKLLKRFSKINAIVIGEGENTLLEIIQSLQDGLWKKVKGICYLEKDEIVNTGSRELIKDLNNLSYPERYHYYSKVEDKNNFYAIISASRGCYANCSFCSIQSFYKKLIGKRLRIRNPIKVVDEIEHIVNTYGITNFFFADDNFIITNKIQSDWLDTFINEIKKRELSIKFDMDCRVNDIDINLFKELKEVGLNSVFLGIESFNQRVLNTLNKNVKVEENINAILSLRKLRLNAVMGFIMFDMFTSIEEIRENLAVFDKIKYYLYFNYDRPVSSDWVSSILYLYNGTPILHTLQKDYPSLLIKNDFGYSFKFKNDKVNRFYSWLLQWKPTIRKMIQLDTLNFIKKANNMSEKKYSRQLHKLSRNYMMLDRDIFISILDSVAQNQEDNIPGIINNGKIQMDRIKKEIISIKKNI
jgi:hypothetical protein